MTDHPAEVVERMAIAMAETDGLDWTTLVDDVSRAIYRDYSRAALDAMGLPSRGDVLSVLEDHKLSPGRTNLWRCSCGFIGTVGEDTLYSHRTDLIFALFENGDNHE